MPARLEEKPDSWIAFTDLVFIDPSEPALADVARTGRPACRPHALTII